MLFVRPHGFDGGGRGKSWPIWVNLKSSKICPRSLWILPINPEKYFFAPVWNCLLFDYTFKWPKEYCFTTYILTYKIYYMSQNVSKYVIKISLIFFPDFRHVPESEIQSKLEHLNHIMSHDWPQDPSMFYAHCKYC